jgi:hypothetical protein
MLQECIIITSFHKSCYWIFVRTKKLNATLETICLGIEVTEATEHCINVESIRLRQGLNTGHVWWGRSVVARRVADVKGGERSCSQEEQPTNYQRDVHDHVLERY